MALCELDVLKALLGVATSAQDVMHQATLDAACAAVEAYCQRRFESADYAEYYNGNGQYRLALRQRPVTSVAVLKVDEGGYFGKAADAFGTDTVLEEGVDWVLDYDVGQSQSTSGIVYRIGASWPATHKTWRPGAVTVDRGPSLGNVYVSYTAGYSVVPTDVSYAAAQLAAHMLRTFKFGGVPIISERLGSYAYHLGVLKMNPPELGSTVSILSRYREFGW